MFDVTTFSELLNSQKSMHFEDKIEMLLENYLEEERPRKRELLDICHRIMKARSMEEVQDISLEDIARCIEVHKDFYKLYCESKACVELQQFGARLHDAKTLRRRRVI